MLLQDFFSSVRFEVLHICRTLSCFGTNLSYFEPDLSYFHRVYPTLSPICPTLLWSFVLPYFRWKRQPDPWCCHYCELLSLITIWVFEFCHSLSFWVLSQFTFLNFGTFWVFKFCHILTFWALSHFMFLAFVTFWLFEFFLLFEFL